ncbi:putative Cyclin-dependent kinase 9 [Blattamonas nauphoetae]|uniref:Cyclin-dependent kinase 9 n=1 Tax=Blattamonas nauphoetae TaxID=2049346 RepID=A0ABQ9X6Q5_9EUKA|nr:putative Cyclin-dependent kinase 9 [Blattamonas nauphoetae]
MEPTSSFDGQYEKCDKLEPGRFGSVFKVKHRITNEFAAVKIIPIGDESDLEKNERKFQRLQSHQHENIVKLIEFFEKELKHYVILELCSCSLADIMKESPTQTRLNHVTASRVMQDVLNGLSYLHGRGQAFEDLKPSRILISVDGTAKLCFFGRTVRSTKIEDITKSEISTIKYWPPERFAGSQFPEPTMTGDMWAFGMILLEIVTKQPWITGTDGREVSESVLRFDVHSVLKSANITGALESIILQLLAKNPSERILSSDLASSGRLKGVLDGPQTTTEKEDSSDEQDSSELDTSDHDSLEQDIIEQQTTESVNFIAPLISFEDIQTALQCPPAKKDSPLPNLSHPLFLLLRPPVFIYRTSGEIIQLQFWGTSLFILTATSLHWIVFGPPDEPLAKNSIPNVSPNNRVKARLSPIVYDPHILFRYKRGDGIVRMEYFELKPHPRSENISPTKYIMLGTKKGNILILEIVRARHQELVDASQIQTVSLHSGPITSLIAFPMDFKDEDDTSSGVALVSSSEDGTIGVILCRNQPNTPPFLTFSYRPPFKMEKEQPTCLAVHPFAPRTFVVGTSCGHVFSLQVGIRGEEVFLHSFTQIGDVGDATESITSILSSPNLFDSDFLIPASSVPLVLSTSRHTFVLNFIDLQPDATLPQLVPFPHSFDPLSFVSVPLGSPNLFGWNSNKTVELWSTRDPAQPEFIYREEYPHPILTFHRRLKMMGFCPDEKTVEIRT